MHDPAATASARAGAVATSDEAGLKRPYAVAADEVARAYGTHATRGLSTDDVETRLERHGPNRLAEPARRHALLRFLDQFRSLLIVILMGAAVLAGLVGELKDAVVIGVVLLINATIGFVMENRAERSLEALRTMLSATARVRREGAVQVVDAEDVVPGDVVLLDAGDRLPADGRLLVAESVEADESALTGESRPVVKTARPTPPDAVLAERRSMAYMNTTVTRGRAELLVTATGMSTEVGAIAGMLATSVEPKNPLQVQLDSVGRRITVIGGIAVAVYAALALLQGAELGDVALSAVALAVATVPEGLPAVLALTLALGVSRMARRGAVVKRLASVETLGAATVVCSDKTGTLTLNRMTVRSVVSEGREVDVAAVPHDAVTSFVLCNDASVDAQGQVVGDPTEGALVMLGRDCGVDVEQLRAATPG
jgi:P-type Ca2+ transporter type 2C